MALARALAARPDVLILDEAFSSLDETTSARMRDLVQRLLRDGDYCTILVSHNLAEAVAMADRVLVMGGSPPALFWIIICPHWPTENTRKKQIFCGTL